MVNSVLTPILAEEAAGYSLGLNAATVTKGFFDVVVANIPAVLTLLGVMFGVAWIMRRFKKAKNASV